MPVRKCVKEEEGAFVREGTGPGAPVLRAPVPGAFVRTPLCYAARLQDM